MRIDCVDDASTKKPPNGSTKVNDGTVIWLVNALDGCRRDRRRGKANVGGADGHRNEAIQREINYDS